MPIVTVSNKSKVAIQKLEQKQADMELFVQQVISKGKKWTDPEFPPEAKSLWDPQIDQVDESQYRAFKWKRASDIYKPVYVFEDGVEPNDIN